MSASIYWSPVKRGTYLPVAAPQSFMVALERLGSPLPWTFGGDHMAMLQGFQAGLCDENQRAVIGTLLSAIEEHGEIRVWPEY